MSAEVVYTQENKKITKEPFAMCGNGFINGKIIEGISVHGFLYKLYVNGAFKLRFAATTNNPHNVGSLFVGKEHDAIEHDAIEHDYPISIRKEKEVIETMLKDYKKFYPNE